MSMDLRDYEVKAKEIELGNRKFRFRELSLSDFAKFHAWVAEKREAGKDKRRERMMAEAEKIGGIDPMALLEKLDAPITEDELDEQMYTIDGMGFLVYLSLKYQNPGVTIEQAMSIVTIKKIPEIAEILVGGKKKPEKKKSGVKK